MEWWNRMTDLKRAAVVVGALGSLFGGLVAANNGIQAAEPYWPATHGYVREQVSDATAKIETSQQQMTHRQVRMELQLLRGQLQDIKAKIQDRDLLMKQDGPPQFKELARQQLDDFKDRLIDVQREIDERTKELSGRHPQ